MIEFLKRIPCPSTTTIPTPCLSLRSSLILIMSHEVSISLEETNKLRISLGLKPLTDDNASVDSAEKRAEDNYAKQRGKEAQDREKKCVHPPQTQHLADLSLFPLSEESRIK